MTSDGRRIAKVDWSDHLWLQDTSGDELSQIIAGTSHDDTLVLSQDHQYALRKRLQRIESCPYCSGQITIPREHTGETVAGYQQHVLACELCGFWRVWQGDMVSGTQWSIPYVRGFQPEGCAIALGELQQNLQSSHEKTYSLTPTQFEILVGTILADFFDCEVRHVGRSGDGGVDLLVIDANDPLMVQVKRRARGDAVEGLDVVKHMFASMYAKGGTRGLIATSAQRFTRGAKSWVRSPLLIENGFSLDLVDINRLIDMTRKGTSAETPAWERVLALGHNYRPHELTGEFHIVLDGSSLRIMAPDEMGRECVFSRADRDGCRLTTIEPGQLRHGSTNQRAESADESSLSGFGFIEMLDQWPGWVMNRLFAFWAGESDEYRIVSNF